MKFGKSTFAVRGDKVLLLAFEKGYRNLPGARVVDIKTWAE